MAFESTPHAMDASGKDGGSGMGRERRPGLAKMGQAAGDNGRHLLAQVRAESHDLSDLIAVPTSQNPERNIFKGIVF